MQELGAYGNRMIASQEFPGTSEDTECPVFVGPGPNHMGFQEYYDTQFLPRAWNPFLAKATKKMHAK